MMDRIRLEDVCKTRKLGVVLHDSGAANQVLSLLFANNVHNFLIYASGPARKICESFNRSQKFYTDINHVVNASDVLMIGTGWSSQTELSALAHALIKKKKTVTFFDHWSNYEQRLNYKGVDLKPSTIWVSDDYAYQIAKNYYPTIHVEKVPNYYLANEVHQIGPIPENCDTALYLCEPIVVNKIADPILSQAPLRYAISRLNTDPTLLPTELIIRPHPSQQETEFSWINDLSCKFRISISKSTSLHQDISACSNVFGYNTYALVIAHSAMRQVFCSAPPKFPQSLIPLKELIYLRD